MEEQIKIFWLGQEILLDMAHVLTLTPILTTYTFQQIKLPLYFRTFKVNLPVLHACLYYLIAIERNLFNKAPSAFREECLSSLSHHYLQSKMNFEIYEYGYLCSKILSHPLEKCMHVIYFMIYARLASKPYISALITQVDKKSRHSRKKT
jgi:hypothetical protein